MAKEEPTTVERVVTGKVINPREIEWPLDEFGITSMLRKEGVRAVGRIKGDPAKLNTFLVTLKLLGEHAKTKLADQQAEIAAALVDAERVQQEVYAREEADKKAEVERLEKALDRAKADLAQEAQ